MWSYLKKARSKYYHLRSRYYRDSRMIFPSPAEVQFIRLMGGRVFTFKHVRHYRTNFDFAIVLSMGRILRREQFAREVRVGSKYVDFGNDIRRGIEIDGRKYHQDIVAEYERDEYFRKYDWQVLHVPAIQVFNEPDKVQQKVMQFLSE